VKGPFFSTTFTRPFKDQSGAWRNGTSFGLNALEVLVTVAREAKEWIGRSRLEALSRFKGKPPVLRGLSFDSFTLLPLCEVTKFQHSVV
jgi:hypothetical protein